MRIITEYPIIKNGRVVKNKFSNYAGTIPAWQQTQPSSENMAEKVYGGKPPIVMEGVESPKVTPEIKDSKLGKFLRKAIDNVSKEEKTKLPTEKIEGKGISNTTKIALIGGGSLVLLTLIYLITKK